MTGPRASMGAWALTAAAVAIFTAAQPALAAPFRISIDGEPILAADKPSAADQVRRTDTALERADVQVRFDGLESTPVLNVTATPGTAARGEEVTFMPYSNYAAFLVRAELRIFEEGASIQKAPMAVIELDPSAGKSVSWKTPESPEFDRLQYVLRVYDKRGRYDETAPQLLRLTDQHRPFGDEEAFGREALTGYGENHLSLKNIPVAGGSVTVNGGHLAPGAKVWAMGREVPVDANGAFAVRQIVPSGDHPVDVVIEAKDGGRLEFTRPIRIPANDWFYVAKADLTTGQNNVNGPAALVTGDSGERYQEDYYFDGQLAFYAKGKINEDWTLTSSADTQERPLEHMFTNFNDKNPRYLLQRVDPSAYYTTYGDDSTAVEDAPTQGKFYAKIENGDSELMWGNFETAITGTDLLNYSRTLYGANGEFRSGDTTKFGERRTEISGFAADPGSIAGLEEHRGTGGSLYYLRAQDLVVGSERIRVEVRDRDSGIVLQSTPLAYGHDYEISYLQGRIILREPLASTADGGSVVSTGTLSGNPAYLVVNYEYTPGVSEIENSTKGGRATHWISDAFRVGVTGYEQGGIGMKQELVGADALLRYAPGTYLKLETGHSKGPGTGALSSQNGGFNFSQIPQTIAPNLKANAYRAEVAADLAEVSNGAAVGTVNAYLLKRDNGYSAPGQLTNEGITQIGLVSQLPIGDKVVLDGKVDRKRGITTGVVNTAELAGSYRMNPADTLTLAVRGDERETALSAGNSYLLADTGKRTDGAVKLNHAPLKENGEKERYEIYGLGQMTIDKDPGRLANNRGGGGGRYDVNDRVTLTGESTAGNGGWGGKAGVDYRASDRTSYYANYVMDNERSDLGYRGRNSHLTSGVKSRYSDSLSVFNEERYQNVERGPSGLIHAFGLDLAANDRWTLGGRAERGTLADALTGDIERTAASVTTGYHLEKTKYAGTHEWREDDGNVSGQRISWLTRNNLSYQSTLDWRFLGGADFAISQSGFSENLDADFAELTAGYAYRPVANDRLNLLFKYAFLSDQASPGQLAASGGMTANSFEQRSHVMNIDGIYDLTQKLSVGGKFGYRVGELRDATMIGSKWYMSRAWLAIARADYHVLKEWDLTGELRYLAAEAAQDAKFGALIGVYRHLDETLKLGIGYNFTDFSDNLTDLDYTSGGFFVNLIGEY